MCVHCVCGQISGPGVVSDLVLCFYFISCYLFYFFTIPPSRAAGGFTHTNKNWIQYQSDLYSTPSRLPTGIKDLLSLVGALLEFQLRLHSHSSKLNFKTRPQTNSYQDNHSNSCFKKAKPLFEVIHISHTVADKKNHSSVVWENLCKQLQGWQSVSLLEVAANPSYPPTENLSFMMAKNRCFGLINNKALQKPNKTKGLKPLDT